MFDHVSCFLLYDVIDYEKNDSLHILLNSLHQRSHQFSYELMASFKCIIAL